MIRSIFYMPFVSCLALWFFALTINSYPLPSNAAKNIVPLTTKGQTWQRQIELAAKALARHQRPDLGLDGLHRWAMVNAQTDPVRAYSVAVLANELTRTQKEPMALAIKIAKANTERRNALLQNNQPIPEAMKRSCNPIVVTQSLLTKCADTIKQTQGFTCHDQVKSVGIQTYDYFLKAWKRFS
jgi:hypothetical protein